MNTQDRETILSYLCGAERRRGDTEGLEPAVSIILPERLLHKLISHLEGLSDRPEPLHAAVLFRLQQELAQREIDLRNFTCPGSNLIHQTDFVETKAKLEARVAEVIKLVNALTGEHDVLD